MRNYAPNSAIRLSVAGYNNEGVATLDAGFQWSDIDGLTKGWVINDAFGGSATITAPPQPNSADAPILVSYAFRGSQIPRGSWLLRVPDAFDITKYFASNLEDTIVLPDYFQALQIFDSGFNEISDSITRVLNSRSWDKMDEEDIVPAQKDLGFFFNLNKITPDQKRRLTLALPYFYTISGTAKSVDFLSFILNTPFTINQLWTTDYVSFHYPPFPGDYPTNHVSLLYNPSSVAFDAQLLMQLFYYLAPIEWVVDSVVGTQAAFDNLIISEAGIQYKTEYGVDTFP